MTRWRNDDSTDCYVSRRGYDARSWQTFVLGIESVVSKILVTKSAKEGLSYFITLN